MEVISVAGQHQVSVLFQVWYVGLAVPCGINYSNSARLAIILGTGILFGCLIHAFFRKFPTAPGMPLAATCSMAISANCHRLAEDVNAHLLPVQWGVYNLDDGHGRAKCAFTTSRYVQQPRVGQALFGLPKDKKEKTKTEEVENAKRHWCEFNFSRLWTSSKSTQRLEKRKLGVSFDIKRCFTRRKTPWQRVHRD